MGVVYRAIDRATGCEAALKILHDEATAEHDERLQREARLLSELSHPAVVRYIAAGTTDSGRPYLAMEWLQGEDLAARLRRASLGAGEAVRICARAAAALGAAHARGIVHRDIKPSNLFVIGGDVERLKVLDFGIARSHSIHDTMTRSGLAIGTPRYMAPEQARGQRDLDARADVYSLGCVLYECLVGRPPFEASNPAALLAKIVIEEPRALRMSRGDLPPQLDHLVARMLAKDPAARPRDGRELAAELEQFADLDDTARASSVGRVSAVSIGEQRLMCLVFAASAIEPPAVSTTTEVMPDPDATRTMVGPASRRTRLHDISDAVVSHRGRMEVLADGSVVITLLSQGAATDQAARAARCALALRGLVPEAPISLAIGRAVVGDRLPLGELIDRATALVAGGGRAIRVDEVSAGLLDTRFVIEGDAAGLALSGERDVALVTRKLLGKPTPCVGRERELATLGAILDECVGEPMAHIVLVTGAAGVGKSRLRYEVIERLASKHAMQVWIGRGDAMSAGTPFTMLAQALRRAARIVDNEPLSTRASKLRARVLRHVPRADAIKVTPFLGELIDASFDDSSLELAAARNDPQLMGDQMLRACEVFVRAECEANPVLLVLEDLQWGDRPSVQFVDQLVRRLADKPLLVLALARPDIDAVFPRLWSERGVERIHLRELTKRAAEKLVRDVLGADLDPAMVERLVERAAGNAFYLEELIRSIAEGHDDRLPETVVAMVQARVESLEPEARHVLRAASVFGQVFWRSGVVALLEPGTTAATDWLDELVERELLTARRDSRLVDEIEYTFRHGLVREAAYAMLTDHDRKVGHKLAGEWLESRVRDQAGDADAVALAEHFLRGDELRRASTWFQHAAEQALAGDDLASACERAERAIACVHAVGDTAGSVDNEIVGRLRGLQAGAHGWRGEYALAVERGTEAIARLTPATVPWLDAAAAVAQAAARQLAHDRVTELVRTLATLAIEPHARRSFTHAVAMTMTSLLWNADPDLVARIFERLDESEAAADGDPVTLAWVGASRAWRAMREGDHVAALELDRQVETYRRAVGDIRNACQQRANVGYGEMMLGDYEHAERSLREAIETSTRIGLHHVTVAARHNLGLVLARRGKLDEARAVETAALASADAQGNLRLAAAARNYLALIEIAAGHTDAAIEYARQAIAGAADKPGSLCGYHATLSTAYLLAGDGTAALAHAKTAKELVERHGHAEEADAAIRLAYGEAMAAVGDSDGARAAIADAARRLREAAERISDPRLRRTYLDAIPEHARTLALDV